MMEIRSLALAINEVREFACSAEYFEVRDMPFGLVLIEILDRSGGVISRLPVPAASDFVKPGKFETVRVTNGATAQTIRMFIGSGDAGSRRVSGTVSVSGTVAVSGNVSVIDGGKARTIAGQTGSVAPVKGAVIGENSRAGIWNPVGSGKSIIVKRAYISSSVSQSIYLGRVSVAPVSLAAANSLLLNGAAFPGAALSAAESSVGFGTLSALGSFTLTTSPVAFELDEPVVIMPGYGLMFAANTVNSDISVTIPFIEE